MHLRRHLVRRARAAQLLVQLAVWCLPDVRRPRDAPRGGPRACCARSGPVDRGKRDRPLVQLPARVLVPTSGRAGRGLRLLDEVAMAKAVEGGAGGDPVRLRPRDPCQLPEQVWPCSFLLHDLRRRHPGRRTSLQGLRVGYPARAPGAIHEGGGLPGLQGSPAQARDFGGDHRGAEHLGAHPPEREGRGPVPRPATALRARAHDRGANAEGDPRATAVPAGCWS